MLHYWRERCGPVDSSCLRTQGRRRLRGGVLGELSYGEGGAKKDLSKHTEREEGG